MYLPEFFLPAYANTEAFAKRDTRFNCQAVQEDRRAILVLECISCAIVTVYTSVRFLRSGLYTDCSGNQQPCEQAMNSLCAAFGACSGYRALASECSNFRHSGACVTGVIGVSATVEAVNLLRDLPLRRADGLLHMVVESPKGSGIKLKYTGDYFEWSRPLCLGLCFPFDVGFLPQTLAPDGDALDVMLLTDLASYPGVVVPAKVVGALKVEQRRDEQEPKRNDRIMLVPSNEHRSAIAEVESLSPRIRSEIEAFSHAALQLTGKITRHLGWASAAEAEELVAQAEAAFRAG